LARARSSVASSSPDIPPGMTASVNRRFHFVAVLLPDLHGTDTVRRFGDTEALAGENRVDQFATSGSSSTTRMVSPQPWLEALWINSV